MNLREKKGVFGYGQLYLKVNPVVSLGEIPTQIILHPLDNLGRLLKHFPNGKLDLH